jgi:hypothetical protein
MRLRHWLMPDYITINASVNSNQGLVMVNQSVGDNNNQATVVNVAAIASFVALP